MPLTARDPARARLTGTHRVDLNSSAARGEALGSESAQAAAYEWCHAG
ncbi:hypothetical protein [Streptomyces abyssomicinicus]|nr:hypothetical protein [Streptomyces abyssomicinicus]